MTLDMSDQAYSEDNNGDPVFTKMEALIRQMQDPKTGIPVRSQKTFLSSIPCAFLGNDVVEWLMDHLDIEEQEALHLATLLCQHGYFFPVNDSKLFTIKDDSTLYRFQTPYFWPSHHQPDNTDYAIYLVKRSQISKPKHSLDDFEQEALARLKKLLCHKWDFICSQAAEQSSLVKERKKTDKVVMESQERAYWHVYRPPPGSVNCLEQSPVHSKRTREKKYKKDAKSELERLKHYMDTPKFKVLQAMEGLIHLTDEFSEFDPFICNCNPSNPWVSEDTTMWNLNQPLSDIPTEKRLKKWALSLDHLLSDPTGLREFELYLKKEFSHENICFWKAVQLLKRGSNHDIDKKVKEIYNNFLVPGAPCEVNLDSKTIEITQESIKRPFRGTFESAQQHVFQLMKNDTYPRFIRSEHYKELCQKSHSLGVHKKRFCNFGSTTKKKSPLPNKLKLHTETEAKEKGKWPFSGRHSHSTSDLHDIDSDSKPASSTMSSPSGSRECVTDTSSSTLQVPRWGPTEHHSSLEEPIAILVPASPNRVAPWESDNSSDPGP